METADPRQVDIERARVLRSEGRSLFDLGALLTDLRDLLGCEVDVATERSLRPRVCGACAHRRRRLVRDDADRLLDMIEMGDFLIAHASDPAKLRSDPVTQAAAQRWIEVLGEAASRVSAEVQEANPDVPWRTSTGTSSARSSSMRSPICEITSLLP